MIVLYSHLSDMLRQNAGFRVADREGIAGPARA